jgi:hypothetical protein
MIIVSEQVFDWLIDFWCLTPLSAIFQLYHGYKQVFGVIIAKQNDYVNNIYSFMF